MDLPAAEGAEGTLPRGSAVLLGHLEILAQQIGGDEPLDLLVPRSSVEQTVAASHGCDIPPFEGLHDFKTWAEEAPPKGTIYHYPPRGDVEMVIRCSPAPAGIANQIYAQATAQKMIGKCTIEGQSSIRRSLGPPRSSRASAGSNPDGIPF